MKESWVDITNETQDLLAHGFSVLNRIADKLAYFMPDAEAVVILRSLAEQMYQQNEKLQAAVSQKLDADLVFAEENAFGLLKLAMAGCIKEPTAKEQES